MSQEPQIEFRVYEGPNLIVPHAAVIGEFVSPFSKPLSATRATRRLSRLLPANLVQGITLPPEHITFDLVVAELTNALLRLAGPCELQAELQQTSAGCGRVITGFYNSYSATEVCRLALRIAGAVFAPASKVTLNKKAAASMIDQAERMMRTLHPGPIAQILMRLARARGIPVYPACPGSMIWQYGQGSAGWLFIETASHRDSAVGAKLAANKVYSNQLITRLGLPGTEQRTARTSEALAPIAEQLGFPLVLKPVDKAKGLGVRADITTIDELRDAYEAARPHSSSGVIVEQQIPGDDYRLAVIGGKLKWAVRRSPPQVIGNGKNTLTELIDIENNNRSDADVAAGFVSRLKIDADMLAIIAKQGLTVEDRPAPGQSIRLRSIANVTTGGTITHCLADVHPDNREMAEAIARSFRMDVAGIDFMTTDISKSWREVPGAVIEVNAMPEISSDERGAFLLEDKFPPGQNGRIPSVVLIDADDEMFGRACSVVETLVKCVGQTDSNRTQLAGRPRCNSGDTLAARVLALVLDVSCEALVISTNLDQIEEYGLPLDRCDLALIGELSSMSPALRRLIESRSRKVISGVSCENFDRIAMPSITSVVNLRHQRSSW